MFYVQIRNILILVSYFHREKLEVFGIDKRYIGCIVDQSERTLPYERLDSNAMTNNKCASHCCSALDGATFSGTMAWTVCFCSNVTNTDKFAPRDLASGKDCNMACSGNQNEICGGSWSLSVYALDCSTDTTVTSKTLTLSETSTVTVDYSQTNSDKPQMITPNSPSTTVTSKVPINISTTNSDKPQVTTPNSPIRSDIFTVRTTNSRTSSEISTVTITSPSTSSGISTVTTDALQTTQYISTMSTEPPKTANSQSTFEITQFDQKSTGESDNSVCSCADCLPLNTTVWTEEEIAIKVTLLKNAISINKKETHLYKNVKRSAYDSRKSARNIGLIGIIVIMLPLIFVIAIDILSILTAT